jgi:uncharacterized SAM-binding protein YcdF (DUF218 family)
MTVRYDAVVVLGAAPADGGGPSLALIRRVRHGTDIFKAGLADVLILSGGPVRHAVPEAHIMRALALEAGIEPERILIEDRSTRTLENAINTARLMASRGWRRALIVTDPCHLPRALVTFRWFDVAAEGSAAPGFWRDGPWWSRLAELTREAFAFVGYLWILRRRASLRM